MAEPARLSEEDGAFGAAVRRLDEALTLLEARLAEAPVGSPEPDPELLLATATHRDALEAAEAENRRLAAELAAARARESALEEVAAEASAALGRAADEVRAALAAEER